MSVLVRTGTGINDVQWKDKANAGDKIFTSGKVWQQSASGGTYTCLQRTGGGIADVAYKSITVGTTVNSLASGSIIKIKENGTLREFIVLVSNYSGTGRTLVCRKNTIGDEDFSGTTRALYPNSNVDKYLENDYYNSIDSNIRKLIAGINIQVDSAYDSKGTQTINRKVFCLSYTELGGSDSEGNVIGSAIPYFNSNDRRKAVDDSGNTSEYWARNRPVNGNYHWFGIDRKGALRNTLSLVINALALSRPMRPAFTLPGNTVINKDTGEIIG